MVSDTRGAQQPTNVRYGAQPTTPVPGGSLAPVRIEEVTIEDEFWSPKLLTWRTTTLQDVFGKFEQDGALRNFDRVRDGLTGGHCGPPWYDGLIYEMIRATSDFLAASPDAALSAQLDRYIARIAAAALRSPAGYINTYTQLEEPGHEWGLNGGFERWQHDVYNAGALVEAAVHHYRATGSIALLQVAVRLANSMCDLMGERPRRPIVPSHSLPEEALIELCLLFRERPELVARLGCAVDGEQYLRLAEFWIEERGRHCGRPDWEREGTAAAEQFIRAQGYGDGRPSWGAYAQDHQSVFVQQTIEGHAVRATLLAAGLAAAARVNDQAQYRQAAQRLWTNLVARRMYISGGVGAYANEEKFGADYVLPNDGYLETCAAVGAAFFHRNMHLAFGHARYLDQLERVLYNGALVGASLHGDRYTYENPLAAGLESERWSWHRCPCCPPMFLKLMSALPGYVYASDSSGIYVNLYLGSRASIRGDGWSVSLRQTTRYPWEGRVTLRLDPDYAAAFTVSLRIPSWCRAATVTINGELAATTPVPSGYVRLHRLWQQGDAIDLLMIMPVERMKAYPRVQAAAGRTALMRGPILYCLESVDHADPVESLILPEKARLTVEYRADLLGGVCVLRGTARAESESEDAGTLYAPADRRADSVVVPLLAIPYYAHGNRGPAAMLVWMLDECAYQTETETR